MGASPRLRDASNGEDRGQRHDLTAQDEPVEIDGRLPGHVPTLDHERPDGPRGEAETAPPAPAALTLRPLSATATGPALDPGGGDDGHAVLLERLAEHEPAAHDIPGAIDRRLHVHACLLRSLDGLESTTARSAWRMASPRATARPTITADAVVANRRDVSP